MSDKGRQPIGDPAAALLCALGSALIAIVPFLMNHRAYYHDNMQDQYMPTFVSIGHTLSIGQWPDVTLKVLNGGALLSEYQYALLNPVSLLSYIISARFHDLETAAACLAVMYYSLLGAGAFALARACGANRSLSSLVALSFASNNFMFYWYASSWFPGLVGTVWLVWATVFVIQAASSPIAWAAATITSFMVATAGWPHALAVFALITAVVATCEYFRKGVRAAAAPLTAALTGIMGALPAIVPLLATGGSSARSMETLDKGLLQQNFYNVLAFSNPFQLGHYITFGGIGVAVGAPMFLAAWYLSPLAPLLDWQRLRSNKKFLVILGLAITFALATQGPEQFFSLRYTLRYLPYLHLSLLIAFAVAATEGGSFFSRRRVLASIGILAFGTIASLQVQPDIFSAAIAVSFLLLPLLLLAMYWLPASPDKATTVLIGGVGLIFLITHAFIPQNPNLPDRKISPRVGEMSELSTIPEHYSISVGYLDRAQTFAKNPANTFHFGNMNLVGDVSNLAGYSSLGYKRFNTAFCIDPHGTMCPEAMGKMAEGSKFGGHIWLDLFKVDRISFLTTPDRLPAWNKLIGWSCSNHGNGIECQRIDALPQFSGSASYLSPGLLTHAHADSTAELERIDVQKRAGHDDLILFDRIPWPGYHANFDGHPLTVNATETGLMIVRLPDGNKLGELILSYTPPGQEISLAAAMIAALCLCFGVLAWPRLFLRPATS